MLKPGRVVHDHMTVIAGQTIHVSPDYVVGETIAASTLRPSHGEQVKAVAFSERLLHLVFHELVLGHATGDIPVARKALLTSGTDRYRHFDAQRLAHVGIGVGVDNEYRRLPPVHEITDRQ